MNAALAPHRGTMILVFGILAWFLCPLFGIASWVMGNTDLAEMDAGRMDPEGRGLTSAGKILGMIAIAINVLFILGAIVFFVFLGGMAAMQG